MSMIRIVMNFLEFDKLNGNNDCVQELTKLAMEDGDTELALAIHSQVDEKQVGADEYRIISALAHNRLMRIEDTKFRLLKEVIKDLPTELAVLTHKQLNSCHDKLVNVNSKEEILWILERTLETSLLYTDLELEQLIPTVNAMFEDAPVPTDLPFEWIEDNE